MIENIDNSYLLIFDVILIKNACNLYGNLNLIKINAKIDTVKLVKIDPK